ncbi:MAG: glycosyltransferase family 39 protein, partial [Cyclobacteriaceae bacterium]|nr:glycosyltransferase family 39 protein [Cyclobacteriaceae bacterium]
MTKQLEVGMRNLKLIGDWQLIILFATLKLLLHFITFSNFELHRDAYLYYAQSEHLAWGYISVPPSIAVIGKFATLIFGNTTFGLRFFPALIGAINIVIIGLAVKELGGKKIAITLASLAYLLSPSYLHVNALFQPVSFNHFYWLLSGYLILVMIKGNNPKIWIWIAITFGLAFLNKYSIVFFYTAFAISLFISNYRYLYISKYFIIGLSIGIVIISPNLIWQYQHNWPVLQHMSELRETQLVHVHLSDFIAEQFLMNMQALFLWLVALLVLLFYKKEKQYRLFGFIYIIVIILLMVGSGKSYYSLGIYPILFVFGAYLIEKYSR